MKKYLSLLAALLIFSAHTLAQPAVRLTSASGHPGDEIELSVQTQGLSQVTAMQMNITLPLALSYVEGSAKLNTEMVSNNHQLQVTQTGDQLKIYIYSLQLDGLKDAQGQLITFRLLVGNDPGAYTLKPTIVLSNSSGSNVAATVTSGTITVLNPKILLSAKDIDFGSVPIRSTYTKTLIASNTGNEPLTLTDSECTIQELSLSGLPCTIQPNGQQELTVAYAPTKAGEENASIKIFSNAANGQQTIHIKAQPYSVNELHVKSTKEIDKEQIRVSIEMDNMEAIVATQCAFELPSSLAYVDGSAKINEDRSSGHQLSISKVDGKLKFYIHSTSNAAILGNRGELFSFYVQQKGSTGNYTLNPVDVVLSNAKGENMLSGTSEATVHLSSPKLEAYTEIDFGNQPMQPQLSYTYLLRNVGEAPLTISRIEIDNPAITTPTLLPLIVEAGSTKDLEIIYQPEKDGTFQGVMKVYCDDPDQRLTVVNIQGSTYYSNQVSLSGSEQSNGQYALTIGVNNALPLVALQADLHWIPGMITKTEDINLSDRAGNHQIALTHTSANTYRLFIYSTTNQQIAAGEGALVTLLYNKVDPSIKYIGSTITVDNIILSTPDGKNQSSSSVAATVANKRGDVNGDGIITVADVTAVVDILLERQTPNITVANADMNGDGQVTIFDVVETIHLVLTYEE